MRLTPFLLLASACAEPVVEMQLVLPKAGEGYETSCLTAVEVRVNGTAFPQVDDDRTISCMDVSGAATYAGVRDAIRGKFELSVPDSGLASIEIYGWSGPSACKNYDDELVTPDLLFFGGAGYIGQERIDLPIVPNLGCTRNQVQVRQVDMFAMINGATCATATVIPDGKGGAGLATIMPKLYGKGSDLFGNLSYADSVGNLATMQGLTQVGARSCLAIDGWTETTGAIGCHIGGPALCATAGEYEGALLPDPIVDEIANFDTTVMAKYPGVVIGSVWSAAKTPVEGATIDFDEAHGKVVYIDPPAPGSNLIRKRTERSTGKSGLFLLYTDTLLDVKVVAGALSRTVRLGATDDYPAGAIIVVQ